MTTFLLVLAASAASAALAWIALSRWHRRCLSKAGPTFACRVWWPAGSRPGRRDRTNLHRARAVWIHDVLLVQRGRLFPRLLVLPVRLPDDSIRFAEPGEVNGLTTMPLVMELRLDDGSLVAVAAASQDRTSLAGPFLAAAIATLDPRPTSDHGTGAANSSGGDDAPSAPC